MNKKPSFLDVNRLLDVYEKCLTPKQIKIMNMKYRLDYSLSEISENLKITRSGIQDAISESIKKMTNLEKEIKYIEKKDKIITILDDKSLSLDKIKNKIKGVI